MKETINQRIIHCQNLINANWRFIEEATRKKELAKVLNCSDEIKKIKSEENGLRMLLLSSAN